METREQSAARRKAARRLRRVIVNNDGNDVVQLPRDEGVTAERFLNSRTTPLVGSHVDTVSYCTGVFDYYTHHSDETQLRTGEDKGVDDWSTDLLATTGKDSLQTMVDFCHEQSWECFWSFRVNDTHDASKNRLLSTWKQENPSLLVGKRGDVFPFGYNRWSSVNYGLEQVRRKVLRILKDVALRYDVDGLELDFYRHCVLFESSMMGERPTDEECDLLTDLFLELRAFTFEVAARRNRPFLISIRVPDSVPYCRALGIDLPGLLENDLVDILIGGGYFKLEPWTNWAALGKKYGVPAYAAFVARRLMDGGVPDQPSDLPVWRGETLNAWRAGISGICTFNRFDPQDPIFREIGDPDVLSAREHRIQESFFSESCWSRPETWVRDGRKYLITD